MNQKYEVIIYWSNEDEAFIAQMPELSGCIAHGNTNDEALQAVNEVARQWLQLAQEKGWPIPQPKGRLLYA